MEDKLLKILLSKLSDVKSLKDIFYLEESFIRKLSNEPLRTTYFNAPTFTIKICDDFLVKVGLIISGSERKENKRLIGKKVALLKKNRDVYEVEEYFEYEYSTSVSFLGKSIYFPEKLIFDMKNIYNKTLDEGREDIINKLYGDKT